MSEDLEIRDLENICTMHLHKVGREAKYRKTQSRGTMSKDLKVRARGNTRTAHSRRTLHKDHHHYVEH
ncbi:hypothetical protein AXF42_Ash018292 [Apostasia shenzhenica]|uniref:Uncharacterized protein n=1 Tax=Apostasia shenzhenica TaxID=1088818 RepID=A0A2I0B2P3_9ASPA|nr:hypothetical protein AXF42_Ash018292 [Apostasia shenzhenica]